MGASLDTSLPADLLSELERKYFWWEPIAAQPRTADRILAQAMDLAGFADIRKLETTIGPRRLMAVMRAAQPGWFSARSWEFWRGRLSAATAEKIADEPPKRVFDAATL